MEYSLLTWCHVACVFATWSPLPLLQHTQQGSQFVPQTEPKPEPLSEAISMNGIYRTEETPTQPNGAGNPIPSCEAGPSGVDSTPSETTDTTLVDRSPSRKRAREDDEEEEEAEGSRSVRPRTESYQPPSGLWRRLSEPIFKFVRDFREGFGSTSSAPSISWMGQGQQAPVECRNHVLWSVSVVFRLISVLSYEPHCFIPLFFHFHSLHVPDYRILKLCRPKYVPSAPLLQGGISRMIWRLRRFSLVLLLIILLLCFSPWNFVLLYLWVIKYPFLRTSRLMPDSLWAYSLLTCLEWL